MSSREPTDVWLPDGEPWAGPWRPASDAAVVAFLDETRRASGNDRPILVAVDGRSASGKSTVAAKLTDATPAAYVVHTDDVAWWHSFFGWTELLRAGVLQPLHNGAAVEFTPPAWTERGRQGAIVVPGGARLVVVEGVGAGRHELADLMDAVIWVQVDEGVRLSRETARIKSGEATRNLVEEWQREERPFLAAQRVWELADLIISGSSGSFTRGVLPQRSTADFVIAESRGTEMLR